MIRYNGQVMEGKVEGGRWKVEGGRWKVEGTKNNIDRVLDRVLDYMK
jgi:hypothetical protein